MVTGSTRGIGAATARRLAKEGCKVVVTGRATDLGKAVVADIESRGGTATWIPADLEVEDQVKNLIEQTVATYVSIRILINNAAPVDLIVTGSDNRCHLQTTEDIQKLFASGVYGLFWCCKYALPHMMKQPSGSIVNMTSVVSVSGHTDVCGYSMMKGAVNTLTQSLAVDYGPTIRAHAIVVGTARGTETVDHLLAEMGPAGQGLVRSTVTRLGTVDDMAATAAYLASEDSAITTGALLYCDGGKTMKADLPQIGDAFHEGVPAYKE